MSSVEPERRSTGGGAEAARQAQEMLSAFASVGAAAFDVTFTDAAGEKVGYRGNRSLAELRLALPDMLHQAAVRQHNVIVRPRPTGAALIQLDDLGGAAAERLRPASFLVVCTSPSNFQCWLAVADADAAFARQLRKGAGADLTASGATRVTGSVNFKEKYAPAYPRVETVHANPGRVVTRAELEALGVVPVAEPAAAAQTARPPRMHQGARGWPSYHRCVAGAPPIRGGGRPDISRADFTFCLLALDWGWSIEETTAKLLRESTKAQQSGEAYALLTAQNAAAALERRRGQGR